MEEQKETREEGEKIGSARQWVEDNFRLIVSVFIVIALGATIYSYSQRTKESAMTFDNKGETQEQVLIDNAETTKSDSEKTDSKANVSSEKPAISSTEIVKETSDTVIAVAVKGDGMTKLARKALADTLAKNPDSELTAAHKIYIEDALRKAVSHKGGVHVGTEVSFSKDLIQKTIENSKNLTEKQLHHIAQAYVPRVPSLK